MKRQSLFFQTALRRTSHLIDRLVFFTLRPTHVAHASGSPCGDTECWRMNANGFTGELVFFDRTPPTASDENSTHDAYFAGVTFDGEEGYESLLIYKVAQADGSLRVSILRLGLRSSGFADYFQVYTGTQSADGQLMSGTFQVYTGGSIYSQIEHRDLYSYTRDPQTYSWTATRSSSHPIEVITQSELPRWSLDANGSAGILLIYDIGLISEGLAFGDGMIGNVLVNPDCPNGCDMYFVRATSTDFSTMQVYQGKCTTSPSGTTAVGTFVEIAQGHSGTDYPWVGTYLGYPDRG